MATLLHIVLGNAVMAACLALLAALPAARLCRRPALTHALWVLVLLKLLIPPLWSVPLPGLWSPSVSARNASIEPTMNPPGSAVSTGVAAEGAIAPPSPVQSDRSAAALDLPDGVREALDLDARAETVSSAPIQAEPWIVRGGAAPGAGVTAAREFTAFSVADLLICIAIGAPPPSRC